jgi:uncharacterized protein
MQNLMSMDEMFNEERIIVFHLNQTFDENMTPEDLYAATHCCWRLSELHARKADYAIAVAQGRIREVYRIKADSWRLVKTQHETQRWQFDGEIASNDKLRRCIDKKYDFPSQNPIHYVNC